MADTKISALTPLTAADADEIPINRAGANGKITAAGVAALATANGAAEATHEHAGTDITSGTLDDARLSSNVPLKDAANAFTARQQFSGGQRFNRRAISDANATIAVTDSLVCMTALTASRTLTLPPAASAGEGATVLIQDESGAAGSFPIVIDGDGSETIQGAATQSISINHGGLGLYCTGTAWFILGGV